MNQTVPLADLSGRAGTLDFDQLSEFAEFDVSECDNLYIGLQPLGGVWPTGTVPVLTVTLSEDGLNFTTPTGGSVTHSTAGLKAAVPCRGYTRARAAITTAGSSSGRLLAITARGSRLGA